MWKRTLALLGLVGLALATGTAGSLDPTFGTDGVMVASNGDDGQLGGVAVQADGKVVAVGVARNPDHWRIRRFLADGSVDAAFGDAAEVGISGGTAKRVAIDSSGRIVVAGSGTIQKVGKGGKTTTVPVTAVVRLLSDGSLDSTFGSGGKALVEPGVSPSALDPQPDGKILVGGGVASGSDGALAIQRFLSSGALDTTFGSGGTVIDNVRANKGPTLQHEAISGIAVQSTGRIVVGCRLWATSKDAALYWAVRGYTSSGSLDTSFGSAGMAASPGDSVWGIAVDSLDRVVAAGSRLDANSIGDAGLVIRYTSGGAVDTSFATGGEFLTSIAGYDSFVRVSAVADDKIVLLGSFGSPSNMYVARLDADGQPDATFGGDGFGEIVVNSGVDMAIDADGNAVAGGRPSNPAVGDVTTWVLARWLGN